MKIGECKQRMLGKVCKLVRTDSWMIKWNEEKGRCDMVRTPLGEERHKARNEKVKEVEIGPGGDVSVDFWN